VVLPAGAHFGLTGPSGPVAFAQGSSGTGFITINRASSGFSESVGLIVGALPAGVTAAVSPATTGISGSITFTASSTAVPGPSMITLTGVAGLEAQTISVALVVLPAGAHFGLTGPSGPVVFAQGSSGT